jgi:hypothetical protein
MPNSNCNGYELVKGDGPNGSFVELWDRSLAPGGLAFEAVQGHGGKITVIGHGLAVPLEAMANFISEATAYLVA